MKFFLVASFALTYATSTTASASASSDNTCDNVSVAYPSNLPWVNYEGNYYMFTRQEYNSVCVDPQGQEYEYGAIEGYYGSATPCSTACVEGYSRAEQRGCSANQRPPLNNLVGFQYDCEAATCYCLYDSGTLGNQYEQCFDFMDTGYQGSGPVSTTEAQYGETCYTVEIQSQSGPPGPGSDYCTDAPGKCRCGKYRAPTLFYVISLTYSSSFSPQILVATTRLMDIQAVVLNPVVIVLRISLLVTWDLPILPVILLDLIIA